MTNLKYRADWNLGNDNIQYFYGSKRQCQNKARNISKVNEYGAYVVANDGIKDVGCVYYDKGIISYKEGDKI